MSTAHDNERVIDRLAREHERSAQVRATARQSLRNSGSATDRKYLTMAERGYGVPHLIAGVHQSLEETVIPESRRSR